jgi:hypothetical protein
MAKPPPGRRTRTTEAAAAAAARLTTGTTRIHYSRPPKLSRQPRPTTKESSCGGGRTYGRGGAGAAREARARGPGWSNSTSRRAERGSNRGGFGREAFYSALRSGCHPAFGVSVSASRLWPRRRGEEHVERRGWAEAFGGKRARGPRKPKKFPVPTGALAATQAGPLAAPASRFSFLIIFAPRLHPHSAPPPGVQARRPCPRPQTPIRRSQQPPTPRS